MKYCTNCGKALEDDSRFCPACGKMCADVKDNPVPAVVPAETEQQKTSSSENWFDKFTRIINEFTGGSGAVRPPLKTIFGDTFKKHSTSESEEIFICGTSHTTPELSESGKEWPRPWLWTRILLAFGIAFVLLHLCCSSFGNTNAYPGVIFIGSFVIPIAMLVFFFELNTPKNISFFNTIKYFLIGGCASLLAALFLFDVFSMELNEWLDATLVGIIEESAKLLIVALVIWRDKNAKYAINGLLIGASIGAGFAAFESAGYAFNIFLSDLLTNVNLSHAYSEMTENLFLRALLAPGGHIVWAAMAGYAVMLMKGDKQLTISFLNKKAFWKIFWIPIALHAIWDMPIGFGSSMFGLILFKLLLVVIAWIVIFVLIGNSLSQIGNVLQKSSENAEAEDPTATEEQAATPIEQ